MKPYLLTALLALALPSLALAQDTNQPAASPPATTQPVTVPTTQPQVSAQPAQVTQPAQVAQPAAPAKPAAPAPDTVVTTVGGQDFHYDQFAGLFRLAIARSINAQGIPYSDDIAAQFAPMQVGFLPVFARQQALVQLATKAGFKADPAVIDDKVKALNDQFKNEADLKTALGQSGFASVEQYRQYLNEQEQVSAYLKSVQDKFKFSDSLVQNFYTMHRAAFTQPASACAKHILVGTEAEANDIVKLLKAGGAANTFDKLAQQKSKDPGSAARGGDLGCFTQGQMVPEFDKASFSGPLNELQVVKSQFGYHVIMVTKRNAAGLQPFADVQGKIREQLSAEAAQKYIDSQLKRVPTQLYTDRLGVVAPAPAQPNTTQPTAPAQPAGK